MNGVEQMMAILKADTNVTNKLNSFTIGINTHPAIWHDVLIPADFEGFKTINFYGIGIIDYSIDYGNTKFTYNCRGESFPDAINLRQAVKDALNRQSDGTGDYFFICEASTVLPPADETDSYNAVLTVTVKDRA